MSRRYVELLRKFSGEEELIELINFTILHNQESREVKYIASGSYPEPRDLLGLLKAQLMTTKEHLIHEEEVANGER